MKTAEALAQARISLDNANRRAARILEKHPTVRMEIAEQAAWVALSAKDAPVR